MVKSKPGLVVKNRPSPYPLTEPQLMMREVLHECGVVKGITRAEMMDKMKNCIPETWRRKREEKEEKEKGAFQPPS